MSRVDQLNEVSLAEQAREAIQRAILDGSIAPGERISIERIAGELGVSRTPVREALKALEGDGLVDLEPNRGAVVREVARDDLSHRYAIRGMIEGYAAELACEADAEEVGKELAANCARARKIIDGKRPTEPKSVRDLVALNQAFHGTIRERSNSPTIASLLGRLRNPASFSIFFWSSPARQRDSLVHHEAIVDAFERGDPEEARRRVEQHLLDARDFLMDAPEGLVGLGGELAMSASPPPELVDSRLEVADRIATLTLDRDDVRNELTGTRLAAEIAAVADWAELTEEISVLVVTGAGKSFCAGGNVKDMAARSGSFAGDPYELQRRYLTGIQQMTLSMQRVGLPTIAAVNGAAIGAGFDLACMCDLRIGARGAKLGETFVNLGIIPGDGGAWLLQRLVGYERAAELTFTGRVFDADEALAMGAVGEVVEAEDLLGRAGELAATIAAKPPRALRLTKRLLRSARRMELEDLLDMSAAYQAISHHNEEHAEAIDAFLGSQKRP